jgi:hypothetical protein
MGALFGKKLTDRPPRLVLDCFAEALPTPSGLFFKKKPSIAFSELV